MVGDTWGGWGWFSWSLMVTVALLFGAALAVLVVAAIRYLAAPRGAAARPDSPRDQSADVLTADLARGEIDGDEYRQRSASPPQHL